MVADIYVSTAYILLTFAFADLLRQVSSWLEDDSLFQKGYLEFITTFELCAVCYELGLIAETNGVPTYALYLFLVSLWWEYRWTVSASPYIQVEQWFSEKTDAISAIFLILCQVTGGLMFYRFYLQYLWSLGYGQAHVNRVHQTAQCTSDIQVLFWIAALVEAGAVCLTQLVSNIMSDADPLISRLINAAVGTSLVVLALGSSGGYFNPALATALQYGCKGASVFEHISVYWIADIIGVLGADYLWKNTPIQHLKVE